MSQYSMAYMYDWVRDMYDSDKWRWKVRNMSDNQIMAIFFKEQDKIRERNAKAKVGTSEVGERSGTEQVRTEDVYPQQLSFFD